MFAADALGTNNGIEGETALSADNLHVSSWLKKGSDNSEETTVLFISES